MTLPSDDATAEREIDAIIVRLDAEIARAVTEMDDVLSRLCATRRGLIPAARIGGRCVQTRHGPA